MCIFDCGQIRAAGAQTEPCKSSGILTRNARVADVTRCQLLYCNVSVCYAHEQQNLVSVFGMNVQHSSLNHGQILLQTLYCFVVLVELILNESLVELAPSNIDELVALIGGCLILVGGSNNELERRSKFGSTHIVVRLSFFCRRGEILAN